MIVKIDIVKAAKVLAKHSIESYYISLNKDKTEQEIIDIIYLTNESIGEDGVKTKTLIDFKPGIKQEAERLYNTYFNLLKDSKNYN